MTANTTTNASAGPLFPGMYAGVVIGTGRRSCA
jgi:hypothetical protein